MRNLIIITLLLTISTLVHADLKLEIKKADGSTYWVEHFPKTPQLNKWLDEEKTRKYWKEDYTTEITGEESVKYVPPELTEAEKAKKDKDASDAASIDAKLLDGSAKLEDLINLLKITRGL